jgi:hypothetical protein
LRAVNPRGRGGRQASAGICANKSSLATEEAGRRHYCAVRGHLERAPLETRVATVRDLFERVDVDSRELKALAVWNMTTDQGVKRSDAVSVWLRR